MRRLCDVESSGQQNVCPLVAGTGRRGGALPPLILLLLLVLDPSRGLLQGSVGDSLETFH